MQPQTRCTATAIAALLLLTCSLPNWAQGQSGELDNAVPPVGSIQTDAQVRAFHVTENQVIDGRLDERWYSENTPTSDLVQSLPDNGAEPTERTEVWVGFDRANIYVSARVWDSAPESEWIANEMRRDTNQLRQNDTFGVAFDTFFDRRNGVVFYTNPLGAMADFQITNEGNQNADWNPIWEVRTGRFNGGWTVEMSIPFRSLRYQPSDRQTWGVQFRRTIRRRNEWVHLTDIPRNAVGSGAGGIFRVSEYRPLVGIEAPPTGLRLDAKPYLISGVRSTPDVRAGDLVNDGYIDGGLDVRYGVTPNLSLYLTYNTDFAQVEVDEQQVNLTRFSLLFPEKREFFLEGQGIFEFANRPFTGLGVGGVTAGLGGTPDENAPILFFSRRIGLSNGSPVPILGGARLTGKVGAFDTGLLNVQTESIGGGAVPASNFSVVRLRRDVLARSSVGVLFANRLSTSGEAHSNQTYGVDATVSLADDINFLAWLGRTASPDLEGRESSYRARLSYDDDIYGVVVDHLLVGENFNPEAGFIRRSGFRESFGSVRYSPRPASLPGVRQFTFQGQLNYLTAQGTGRVQERETQLQAQSEFENSDVAFAVVASLFEDVPHPFEISPGITVPAGGYHSRNVQAGYNFGLQRRLNGNVIVLRGSFYGGTRTSIRLARGRAEILPQFSAEPSLSLNWVDLPQGSFESHVAGLRFSYSFSPQMFVSSLVQYNTTTEQSSTNLRFRWEYSPGSELFFVYTDERAVDQFDPLPTLQNRGFVVKVNRRFPL